MGQLKDRAFITEEDAAVTEKVIVDLKVKAGSNEAERVTLREQVTLLQNKIDADTAELAVLRDVAQRESRKAKLEVELETTRKFHGVVDTRSKERSCFVAQEAVQGKGCRAADQAKDS